MNDLAVDLPTTPQVPAVAGPALSTTASVTTMGHFAWLGWTWLVTGIVYAVVLTWIALQGRLDSSLWQDAVAGWQRWPVLAAGFMTVTVFAGLFLNHGVTRRQLSQSSLVSMVVISFAGAVFITVGYAVELAVFRAEGWPELFSKDAPIDGFGAILAGGLAHWVSLAAAFLCSSACRRHWTA